MNFQGMISFEEALHIVSTIPSGMPSEAVLFHEALGRIAATDVISEISMPPFNKSAVDGFACRSMDVSSKMSIIETVAAGQLPQKVITPGTCIRIMTGAPVPEGATTVLMVEDCEVNGDELIYRGNSGAANICFQGEDISAGDILIKAGTLLEPQHIAILASLGQVEINVFRQARVGVLSTGNELVEPHEELSPSKIRNSNSWQLMAQIRLAGGIPKYYGIVPDDFDATRSAMQHALSECDIIMLSGGVSAGDFDFVPAAMKELGFSIVFDSLAVQPGRPTTLAVNKHQYIFGLPGNPVSSFVQFHLLGRVLMLRLAGWNPVIRTIKGITGVAFRRKKAQRKSFLPVTLDHNGRLVPVPYNGSAHINALLEAIGVIAMDQGINEIPEGAETDVRLF